MQLCGDRPTRVLQLEALEWYYAHGSPDAGALALRPDRQVAGVASFRADPPTAIRIQAGASASGNVANGIVC